MGGLTTNPSSGSLLYCVFLYLRLEIGKLILVDGLQHCTVVPHYFSLGYVKLTYNYTTISCIKM
jgi:hypothetical protein